MLGDYQNIQTDFCVILDKSKEIVCVTNEIRVNADDQAVCLVEPSW